jgi:xylulokinase
MPVFVGCDLGTSGTKAAVVDGEGRILGEAFEDVPMTSPRPGWVEQDLLEIEATAHRAVAAAVARSGRAGDIAGVAFSGQMSGIGTIDAAFQPATHFDSWLDARCEPYIVRMAEHADEVTRLSGCPPTYSHGPKILWWRHERPDAYRRVAKFVVPGAFVAGRLAGLPADQAFVDRTYLHFSNLAETERSAWSAGLLDAFGIDEAVLPRIVDPLDVVGEVTRDAAAATGLPAGTPIAAGAGDTIAAALGAGVTRPGQAYDLAGTASVLALCTGAFTPDRAARTLMAAHSVIRGTWLSYAFVNGGGLGPRWFRDQLAAGLPGLDGGDAPAGMAIPYERLDRLAGVIEPGAGGLLWLPHLQGKVLPPQPHVRGGWLGLTNGHTPGHMYRAILEGIAYEYATWARLAAGAAGAGLREARVLGGGASSPLWNQIKADVLGADWVPVERQEAGVLADALIAAAATGHVTDLTATADAWQRTGAPVRPDRARHERYQPLLAAYEALGDLTGPLFELLARAADGATPPGG